MISEQDKILIDKYANDNLSEDELKLFGKKIKDNDFADYARNYTKATLTIQTFLEKIDIEPEKTKSSEKTHKIKILQISLAIAASLIIGIFIKFYTASIEHTATIINTNVAELAAGESNYQKASNLFNSAQIDSILYYFNLSEKESEQYYEKATKVYKSSSIDSALHYFNLSIDENIQTEESKIGKAKIYYTKYIITKHENYLDSCINIYKNYQHEYCKTENINFECKQSYLFLANSYLLKSDNKKAKKYFYILFKNGNKEINSYIYSESYFLWFYWEYIKLK